MPRSTAIFPGQGTRRRSRTSRYRILLLIFLPLFVNPPVLQAADPFILRIEGIEEPALDNVRRILAPPPGLSGEEPIDPRWLTWYRKRIPDKVREAMKPFGHYHPEVKVEQQTTEDRPTLTVRIRPGPPVLLRQVRVTVGGEGRDLAELQRRASDFPLQAGDVLRQDLYLEGKTALQEAAIDLGFLEAGFSRHQIHLWPEENRAEIDLELESGPRFRFGPTVLSGAPTYPDRFLRRYLAYREGEFFSYRSLGQTQRQFLDADRFRQVVIEPVPESRDGNFVPVKIQLDPVSRRRLRPGVGYGTDTGARLSLRYRDANLFLRGWEWTLDGLLAQRRQRLENQWIIPSPRNLNSYSALRAVWYREDPGTYESRSFFLEGERVRGFGRGRQGSVFLRLQEEKYQVGDEASDRSRMVIPGVRFTQRRLENPVRPRQGHQFSIEVRGTHSDLGSDSSLLQVRGGGNLLFSLPWRLTLLLRSEAGTTLLQEDPVRDLPPSLRFFAGGDQSVRGYAYQSLGPKDDAGDVRGGKHLLTGGIELERALGEDWGVALFLDAGNAFDDWRSVRLQRGVGLGVRRYTVVGPIRVDLAYRLGGTKDSGFRFHVSLGVGW